MSIIHTLRASATFLSFCTVSQAWVLNWGAGTAVQDGAERTPIDLRRDSLVDGNLANRQEIELDCSEDRWQDLLNANPVDRVRTFCNEWLGIGPATQVVNFTPTIFITTSNSVTSTVTTTERTILALSTTQTSTSTAPPLTTQAPLKGRAANAIAVAQDIISSVIASGTTAPPPSTKNEQRIQAESGLANACSCKMVDPTATVTSTFTVPPVYSTVGNRKLIITRVTDTIVYTASTMVVITPGVSPTFEVSSGPVASSSAAAASSASQSVPAPQSSAAATTTIQVSSVPSLSPSSTNSSSSAIVTAIPFSCPDSSNKRADQVINDFRFEYLVLCNTELVTQDRVYQPIHANSENDCTAQCSALNAKTGNTTCTAASFTPYGNGRQGGNCTLTNGAATEYVPKEGAIAVVNTGVSSNGDECADIGGGAAASYGPPVDTSALVASITSAGVAIETPGLVTQTADGGVFETYVSANSTDASGYIHWSWYRVSASSSYWWAVYGTSWACTKTITPTIVEVPQSTAAQSSASYFITTIINGSRTTIITNSSTRIIEGDGGVVGPPTFVPASVTSGSGQFTTFFSEATATSTGGNGLISPTASVLINSTFPQTGAVNVSFATSTYFSTGTGGVLPPSSIVPASIPPNITIVSTGGFTTATSGSAFAFNSTGGGGVLTPSAPVVGNQSVVVLTSTTTLTLNISSPPGGYGAPSSVTNWTYPTNSTGVVVVSSGGVNLTISGSTATANSTGGGGIISPTPSSRSTPAAPFANSTSEGSAFFSTGGSTATGRSTGASGIIPPSPSANASTPSLPSGSPTPSLNSSSTSASISDNPRSPFPRTSSSFNSSSTSASISDNPRSPFPRTTPSSGVPVMTINSSIPVVFETSTTTLTLNLTSASVSIPGPSSNVTFSNPTAGSSTIPPVSANSTSTPPAPSVFVSSGSANVTFASSTRAFNSTGGIGVISPSPSAPSIAVFTTGGVANFSLSGGTAVSTRTGSSGIIPPSSANVTSPAGISPMPNVTISTGAFTSATSNSTFTRFSTQGSGVIPPASANSTTPVSTTSAGGYGPPPFANSTSSLPSAVPTPSANVSSSIVVESFATSNGTFIRLSTGTGGIITPSANVTRSVPSAAPTLSANITSTLVVQSFATSNSTSAFFSTGTGGVIPPPFANSTITSAPSAVPTPSLNSTGPSSTFSRDSNSERDRTGGLHRSSSTRPVSVPLSTGASSSIPAISSNGTTMAPSTSSLIVPPFANSTAPPGTGVTVASLSTPAPSLNSTVPSLTPSVSLNSTFPSFTPSISLNSSIPTLCPTAPVTVTEVSVSTQVVTTTVLQIQTVTVGAAVVLPTQVSETSSAVLASSSIALPTPILPPALEDRARQAGQPATQSQIDAACADSGNIVLNPDFAKRDVTVPGWTIDVSDPSVQVDSFTSASGNETSARFSSAVAGRSLTITQPLTLCPGGVYTLSARTRQGNVLAACSVEYSLATGAAVKSVLKVTPKETDASTSASFTVGTGNANAAGDLRITARCDGFQGFPVADEEGWMRVETGDISVVKSG